MAAGAGTDRAAGTRSERVRATGLILICRVCLSFWSFAGPAESGKTLAGAPWVRHAIDDTSRGADGIKFQDINGDERLDMISGWEEGGEVRVYLNPGPERSRDPWSRITVGRVASPEDAIFVEDERRATFCAMSATEGRNRTIYLHFPPIDRARLADENSWMTRPVRCTARRQSWMFLLPMNLDGQPGLDIVTGSKGPDAAIGWLRSPEDPRSQSDWVWHSLRPAGWIMSLIAVDLNADGRKDILFSDRKGKASGVGWLRNPGPEKASRADEWKEEMIAAQGQEVMFLDVGDLDGDGKIAIAAAVKPSTILLLRPSAGRWREEWINAPPGTGTAKAVRIADLDLDGRADLVYSCEDAAGGRRGVIWLRHDARGWGPRDLSGADGAKFDLVATLDLDQDGDLDVLTCEEKENLGVVWYENPTRDSALGSGAQRLTSPQK